MVSSVIQTYFSKMKGQRHDPKKLKVAPKPPTRIQVLISSFVGSFVGIAIVASLTYNSQYFIDKNMPVLAGSFGASAVLIYGAIEAPLSQPRNVIGGHILSSIIGVSYYKLFNLLSPEMFNRLHWLLCSLAVSTSLFVMQITHTVHPPASATALIAVTGGQAIYDLGYMYVLCPIALGVALMMVVAMLVNNVVRTYPSHWWAPKSRVIAVVDQDMSTTLADFVSPEDEDEDQDDAEITKNKTSLTRQPISSSSSLTFSPKENNSVSADNHSTLTQNQHPSTSPTTIPKSISRSHSHGQYAVYYGGDHREELKNGEKLFELQSHASSAKDLEHGHSPTNRRHSIRIDLRGSPHSSHTPSGVSGDTHSHAVITNTTEEEYRATIVSLQQRIQELEARLASALPSTIH
ncbi:hypothetical protein FBU30_008242 [Linnemannia zychae]|nr:hypothetical protein FBU30_008242 [Linnemannia zychae]